MLKTLLNIVMLGLIAGCASSPDGSVNLVGDWFCDDGAGRETVLSFHGDGTFAGHIGMKGQEQEPFAGRWHQARGRIYYVYGETPTRPDLVGATDEDRVIEATSAFFVIRNRLGARLRYVRVNLSNDPAEPASPCRAGST